MQELVKVRITDVAREAGVSTATVDRVINERPGVKERTRRRVMDAAQRLGYLDAAVTVSRLGPRSRLFDFVLPAGTNTYMQIFADALAAGDRDNPHIATR